MHEVNKPSGFKLVCERSWASLAPTADPKIRHCDACGHAVHDCATTAEARAIAAVGGCVALGEPAMKVVGNFATAGEDAFPIVGWFVVGDGPRVLELRADTSTIGSGPAADHVIADPTLAAIHVEVKRSHHGFTAAIHEPGLAMQLNDKAVKRVDLVDNDRLVIGATPLRFKTIA